MASTHDTVRHAIAERHHLGFSYHDRYRIVLPLRLGVTPAGAWQLRGVQVGGDGGPFGDIPKLFAVDQMRDTTTLASSFTVPRQYERKDAAFSRIDAQL